jgi:hypothetical protein
MAAMAAVALGLLALPAAPAAAHVEITDPIVLPQTESGDVVLLPGTRTLVVAGGDGGPVVFVDLDSREVTPVPGTTGVESLDLDQAGQRLHGTSTAPDEVVEIDTLTATVTRRWPVTDRCTSGAVERGGVIWVAQDCVGGGLLQRLDQQTGALTEVPGVRANSVVGEPGGTRLFTFSTSGRLTSADAATGALTDVFWQPVAPLVNSTSDVRISDDGTTLFLPSIQSRDDDTLAWDTTTLLGNQRWQVRALWSDGEVIGGDRSYADAPTLMEADGATVINRFMPDDATWVYTDDVRVGHGNLYTTVFVDGEKRVYVVDAALMSEPQLLLWLPWGSQTGLDTPTPVTGTMEWDGEPVAGAELVLREVSPEPRVLDTVTTGADGGWETTWTPTTTGPHLLEVRHTTTRDSVARVWASVDEVYERIDLSGPTTVNGGEAFEVTATATRNGRPLADAAVSLRRQDWARFSYYDFEQLGTKSTDANGTATWQVPPGAVDGYWFSAVTDFPDGRQDVTTAIRELGVEVLRTPTTLTLGDTQDTAVPGDPVDIPLTLLTGDGQPVAGQTIEVKLQFPQSTSIYGTVTTEDDGSATYVDAATAEGWTQVVATFPGTLTLDNSTTTGFAAERRRIADALTVEAPTEGEVGVPVTVTGSLTGATGPSAITVAVGYEEPTTVTTAADGTWSTEVTPTLPGPNFIAVRFAGDVRIAEDVVHLTITTPRAQPVVALDPVVSRVGEPLRLTGSASGLVGNSMVEVRTGETLVREQSVGVDGVLDVYLGTPSQPFERVYDVTVVANERQEAASASQTVVVEPVPALTNKLRGGTTRPAAPSYRFYQPGVHPRLVSTIQPADTDACVERVVQRVRKGRWRVVDRRCLDHSGELRIATRLPTGRDGMMFRVRTSMPDPGRPDVTSEWSRYIFDR